MRLLGLLAIFILATALIHFTRENRRLVANFHTMVLESSAPYSACVLPPLKATTVKLQQSSILFPRSKPTLILATDRNCQYCLGVLQKWREAISMFPQVDGFVLDAKHSYQDEEFSAAGLDLNHVWNSASLQEPYRSIFSTTPSVILIGRTGSPLGVWKGELSENKLALIKAALNAHLL